MRKNARNFIIGNALISVANRKALYTDLIKNYEFEIQNFRQYAGMLGGTLLTILLYMRIKKRQRD